MAKPCTVTAPAEAAGHRMPVWATKTEGFPFVFHTVETGVVGGAKWARFLCYKGIQYSKRPKSADVVVVLWL
jgi:hypothetical protein